MFRNVNWKDVEIHAVVGIILTFFLSYLFGWFAAVINSLFWIGREIVQDYNKGHKWPNIWPLRWSTQKFWEAVVPSMFGFVTIFAAYQPLSGS